MKKSKLIGWNPEKVKVQMLAYAVEEQSNRLVDYARGRIMMLGEVISMYHSRNNMDRTGNLLDSLCWGVTYKGKYVDNGFYREQRASMASGLHEWWGTNKIDPMTGMRGAGSFYSKRNKQWEYVDATNLPEVWGHQMAEEFLIKQENKYPDGWMVFFAILAPYWGYWEKGFTMKKQGNFVQFAVMTQFRDHIRQDLKPAKVTYRVTSAIKYSDLSLIKQARANMRKNREA